MVCQTDNADRIAFKPVDLWCANFADFVLDGDPGGFWGVVSDRRDGQPGNADGLADVHLFHFGDGATADLVVTTGLGENERAPHLAR